MTNTEFKAIVKGNFFTVSFTKQDGSLRTYKSARVGVRKFTKGGKNNVEHKSNLVTVNLPHENNQYRTLNLDSVRSIKCGDREFNF